MRRLLALLAVLAACVGLTAAPASAERVTGRDARADVARIGDDGRSTRVARPNADLVGYAIRYGDHRISAVLRYRDLQPRGRFVETGIYLSYPGAGDGSASIRVYLTRGLREGSSTADGGDRVCRTRHRVDYRRDLIRVSAPASCFGRPRHIDAFAFTSVFPRRSQHGFVDVAPGGFRDFVRGRRSGDFPTVRVRRG